MSSGSERFVNLHIYDEMFFNISTKSTLAHIVSTLLRDDSIRLYKTSIINHSKLKYPEKWQQDLTNVPLDTKSFGYVTMWCPLQPIRSKNSPLLSLATASHRDKTLTHWWSEWHFHLSHNAIHRFQNVISKEILEDRYTFVKVGPLGVGDCVAYHGWLYYSEGLSTRSDAR